MNNNMNNKNIKNINNNNNNNNNKSISADYWPDFDKTLKVGFWNQQQQQQQPQQQQQQQQRNFSDISAIFDPILTKLYS